MRKQKTSRPFMGLLNEPDRWPQAPPTVQDLSSQELVYFMDLAIEHLDLSPHESNVVFMVLSAARRARRLTPAQINALNDKKNEWGFRPGLLRRAWDCDPDLWHEGPLPGEAPR